MTDLTVFNNYALMLLALIGIASIVIFAVTSLLPTTKEGTSSIASLRYEALRLNDHLKRLREAEGQNHDTMERQASAIRIANTKLNRLQDLLLARERRMQSHITSCLRTSTATNQRRPHDVHIFCLLMLRRIDGGKNCTESAFSYYSPERTLHCTLTLPPTLSVAGCCCQQQGPPFLPSLSVL